MPTCPKHLRLLLALLALPVFLFTSCLKEGEDTIVLPLPYGKIPYDVIPEHIQDSLTAHGFVIYEGVTPPHIEGKYVASPMDMQYASDNYFNPNFRYLYMAFSGQHRRGKINYSQVQHDTIFLNEQQFLDAVGDASRAHVIGEGDNFTMYCIQRITPPDSSWSCETASVVSGTSTKAGIKNCQYAQYLIKAEGDLERIPEIGTYRIWNDGDNLAIVFHQNPTAR